MADTSIWKELEEHDLNGYTLVIPSVAVGNVGQLACDLLISSLSMKKIASVYSEAFIPVVGYDPYDLRSDRISSCCEVFASNEKRLVLMQLRAPLVYKYAESFLLAVVRKFKEKAIKDIVILTSSFAHEKKHIQSSAFRYVSSDLSPHKDLIQSLNWVSHTNEDNNLRIHGGGFATLLYKLAEDESVPCLVLYKYCSEGDNIPDAYDTVCCLNTVIPLFRKEEDLQSQIIQPVSWKLLFGKPPPQDIY
ncbi:hypothetical protein JYU34_005120 [Plutella xylostella]|uniref:Uncharacterized protein n=2 Tax=Plutella xylostella TaxID=51655 RepID=A0ABQ7QVZ0_PLUXY|nr:hypothetical protein JYU34_005120 [Plutella xylostella]CAG9112708.1 unnamed protein product [Plutella xylostella]